MLRVEKGAVCASADLIDDVGLQIGVDCAGDIFALAYQIVLVFSAAYERGHTNRSLRRMC